MPLNRILIIFWVLLPARLWAVDPIAMTGWVGLGTLNVLSRLPPSLIAPTPSISGINPTLITAGDPDFILTVNGSNFQNNCTIDWNGSALPTSFINSGQVTASVASSFFVAAGTATVQVINPDNGASNGFSFSIVPPPQTPVSTASNNLRGVRVYPNPFRSARGDKQITFDQMPTGSTVKIFTLSARWVTTLSAPAGIVSWNLTNDSGDNVASGIYLTLITDGQGSQARGKLTVIR